MMRCAPLALAVAAWIDLGAALGAPGPARRAPRSADARASPRSAAAASSSDAEVLDPSYFASVAYDAKDEYVPWDLKGRPQPPVRSAFERGAFGGRGVVLDCGCGAGDNANFLAGRGVAVHGFDLSAGAVAAAEARRDGLFAGDIARGGGAATFEVANCRDLSSSAAAAIAESTGGFSTILDSALLHCLSDADAARYVGELGSLAAPGATLFLGCFSDANPDPWTNPRRLSAAHIRGLFDEASGWDVASLETAWYERPRDHTGASSMGAFTLAWWGEITRLDQGGN